MWNYNKIIEEYWCEEQIKKAKEHLYLNNKLQYLLAYKEKWK